MELVFVGILTMLALTSSAAPEQAHTSNDVERAQHAAFLLVWEIFGLVIPVVVLFNLARGLFRLLRARYKRRNEPVARQKNEPTRRKMQRVESRRKTKKDGQVGLWILVDSDSESEQDVSDSEEEPSDEKQREEIIVLDAAAPVAVEDVAPQIPGVGPRGQQEQSQKKPLSAGFGVGRGRKGGGKKGGKKAGKGGQTAQKPEVVGFSDPSMISCSTKPPGTKRTQKTSE